MKHQHSWISQNLPDGVYACGRPYEGSDYYYTHIVWDDHPEQTECIDCARVGMEKSPTRKNEFEKRYIQLKFKKDFGKVLED